MDILFKILVDFLGAFKGAWQLFSDIWFIILPAPFYYLFKFIWMKHIQDKYDESIEWVLLEIIPPRDIEKSPKPMESIFSGMAGTDKGLTPVEEFVEGLFPASFSLEIASIGGQVHLFIRSPKAFRNLVEAHVYAQYPNAEILEVPDYVDAVPKLVPNMNWDLWGTDFELVKPDAYPIRTYSFFEESITGTMLDPLSAIIEAMGKIPPDQQVWLQYIITPEKVNWYSKGMAEIEKFAGKEKPKPEGAFASVWSDLMDIIKNIPIALSQLVEFEEKKEEKEEPPLVFRMTPGEQEVLKALESNVGKQIFSTKMRFIYLGERENFSKTVVSSVIGGIKQFSDFHLNGFKPNDQSKTFANFIFVNSRTRWRQRKLFRRYKDRDTNGINFKLSTEELATVFHMPDIGVEAPALTKTDFKRGSAPANLPVE